MTKLGEEIVWRRPGSGNSSVGAGEIPVKPGRARAGAGESRVQAIILRQMVDPSRGPYVKASQGGTVDMGRAQFLMDKELVRDAIDLVESKRPKDDPRGEDDRILDEEQAMLNE